MKENTEKLKPIQVYKNEKNGFVTMEIPDVITIDFDDDAVIELINKLTEALNK